MTDDVTKDSNGNILADGDSVTLIKDLKVKGSGGVTLKRGTLVKNIRLTTDADEIEAIEEHRFPRLDTLFWRDGKPVLEARNARMRYDAVIADESVEVWGVVRASVRNLQG